MNVKDSKIVESDESQNVSQPVDKSRRSFAKKSAAIAPVIMTLANRSAWGGTNVCSNSGWNSFHEAGNRILSHAAIVKNTDWNSYLAWASNSSWPTPFISSSSTAFDVINNMYPPGLYTNNITLAITVLNSGGIDAYRIATVLNELQSTGVPAFLFSAAATEQDFMDFYNACL